MIMLFDIGGTSIKYGIAEENADRFSLIDSGETASNAKKLKGHGIESKITEIIEKKSKLYSLSGISISTAGMVDEKEGCILYANENIPEYKGMNWKKDIEHRFQMRCEVENDVNAAALGEYAYGAGMGCHSLLMMTIGTGIGGAIIQNGQIIRGHSHSAGEIGYMRIGENAFQDIASTTALVKRAESLLNEHNLNGRIIFQRAICGNSSCIKAIYEICKIIAVGIFNCVCLLNPEMVLLGGGIMEQKEYLYPVIDKSLRDVMTEEAYLHTRFGFAKLKNHAGLAGAYYRFISEK